MSLLAGIVSFNVCYKIGAQIVIVEEDPQGHSWMKVSIWKSRSHKFNPWCPSHVLGMVPMSLLAGTPYPVPIECMMSSVQPGVKAHHNKDVWAFLNATLGQDACEYHSAPRPAHLDKLNSANSTINECDCWISEWTLWPCAFHNYSSHHCHPVCGEINNQNNFWSPSS